MTLRSLYVLLLFALGLSACRVHTPHTATEPLNYTIAFAPDANQTYGFDASKYDQSNKTKLNETDYWVAWKSIASGRTDYAIATTEKEQFPAYIGFKTPTAPLSAQQGDKENTKRVSVIGSTDGDTQEVKAYAIQKDEGDESGESAEDDKEVEEKEVTLGLLNVVSYNLVRNKVIVVPVNGVKAPSAPELSLQLNAIYGQAVAAWEVEIDVPFTTDQDLVASLDEGESGIAASFPANMRKFNRKFKRSRDLDKNAYYVFLVDGVQTSLSGFMPFKRQYGYIFNNTEAKTIAHELGHGAFRLRHTFSDEAFIADQGSTDNLMDYSGSEATKLYKHQWDNVHNPEKMIGWFEDDAESAMDICFWTKSVLTYNSVSGKDHVLKPNMPMYNEVMNNFDNYWDQSAALFKKHKFGKDKENNLALKANTQWTIRNATHYKKADETFFVDLAVKAIVDRAAGGVSLHKEGVTLAKITLEGKDYKLAAYSNEENTKPNYVRVGELCDLVDDENVQVYNADGQSFIAFLNGGVLVLVIQILTDDEDDVETWLKYLGILVEEEGSWMSLVPRFWEDWTWGEEEGDEEEGNLLYDYFVTDDDAWYREKESPFKAIIPNPKTNVLAKATQVAVLEVVQDDKKTDVAKVQLQSNFDIEYTSLSNLTQVKNFSKERNYRFLQDYSALEIPFSEYKTDKIYKTDAKVVVDKYFGDYLNVKGSNVWIEKSTVIWIDRISKETFLTETKNATEVGTKFTSNETSVACNICVRAALLLLKEESALFPITGSGFNDPNDSYKSREVAGYISHPGQAKNIKQDLDVITTKANLNYRFTEIKKKEDEGWESFFKRLQDKADVGGIVVGAMLSSGGASGHVMLITPGGLVGITKETSKWGWTFDKKGRGIKKLPRVLECGTGARENEAPLCRNVDYNGAISRIKWFQYNQ